MTTTPTKNFATLLNYPGYVNLAFPGNTSLKNKAPKTRLSPYKGGRVRGSVNSEWVEGLEKNSFKFEGVDKSFLQYIWNRKKWTLDVEGSLNVTFVCNEDAEGAFTILTWPSPTGPFTYYANPRLTITNFDTGEIYAFKVRGALDEVFFYGFACDEEPWKKIKMNGPQYQAEYWVSYTGDRGGVPLGVWNENSFSIGPLFPYVSGNSWSNFRDPGPNPQTYAESYEDKSFEVSISDGGNMVEENNWGPDWTIGFNIAGILLDSETDTLTVFANCTLEAVFTNFNIESVSSAYISNEPAPDGPTPIGSFEISFFGSSVTAYIIGTGATLDGAYPGSEDQTGPPPSTFFSYEFSTTQATGSFTINFTPLEMWEPAKPQPQEEAT